MKGRDHKSKEALIKYLQQDTDERFWQAVSNFARQYGLNKHYLLTSNNPVKGTEDLFLQELDKILDKNKEK